MTYQGVTDRYYGVELACYRITHDEYVVMHVSGHES
jgi:hypothetical protein